MSRLDDSLALTPIQEGVFAGFSDPAYEANSGMFGGWTAALIVKAVPSDPRASDSCSSKPVARSGPAQPASDQ